MYGHEKRWTGEFGFDPKMGAAIGAITSGGSAILLADGLADSDIYANGVVHLVYAQATEG